MKLLALDGNSLINRAFYGIRALSNRDGLPTNAIYGFLNIYLKLLTQEAPDGVCVAFDTAEVTFRKERFESYKCKRKGMPDELAMQMPYLKRILDALGVLRIELPGWEADDILGTVARICAHRDITCVVVTGDRDSLQLVSDKTSVRIVLSKGGVSSDKLYTPEVFQEEYGFGPQQLIDLKALMGDSSDNIPGITGIGEKTALTLVRRFGDIDNLYACAPWSGVSQSVAKKLSEGEEQCRMSKWLATIDQNAPIEFEPEEARFGAQDDKVLLELLEKLELKKLIDRLIIPQKDTAQEQEAQQAPEVTELNKQDFFNFIRGLEKIYYVNHNGVLCAGADEQWRALTAAGAGQDLQGAEAEFLASDTPKVGHAVKEQLSRCGTEGARSIVFDTSVAAYLVDPSRSDYSLEKCAQRDLGQPLPAAGEGPEGALAAAASRAQCVQRLALELEPKLGELGMRELYYDMELPLEAVIARMERAGFLVDRKGLESFDTWLEQGVQAERESIYLLAGEKFNINSTKLLGEVLFEKLGLPPVKKTASGFSTDIEVLEKLRSMHEIVPRIISYRKLSKLKSTYAEGLLKVIAPDGRIHTKLNMTATATGRLSSTEPNLQNIPVRGELGSELRKFFIAPPGFVLIDADYSQIELRVLAHIAEDENMIAAFASGADIHRATAAQVFNLSPEEVTPQMRRSAKAVNFGIVYGISDYALGQDIGVSRSEARRYMDAYFERFRGVRAYMDAIKKLAAAQGYVSTLYGRRRYLPELKSPNHNIRAFGERVALNAPIQGTAADIIKLAMIAIDRTLREEKLRSRLILQVHDELLVEAPEEEAQHVMSIVKEKMAGVANLLVPLDTDAGIGKSWYEAKA